MTLKISGFKNLFLSLTLAASVLMALPAAADGHRHRGGKHSPEQRLNRMQSKLDLSDEQMIQMKAIFESHKSEFERIKSEMKNTFTDDQRQALKEARKNRKRDKSAKRERPSPEERSKRMAKLGISEGQQAQLRSLRQQMKSERELIKQEMQAVLTPEQQTKMEEMKKHRKGRRGNRGQRG